LKRKRKMAADRFESAGILTHDPYRGRLCSSWLPWKMSLRLRINKSVFSIDLEMDKRIHEINDDIAAHRAEKRVIFVATAHHTLASGAHDSAGIFPAPLINSDDKGLEELATEVHLHVGKIGKLLKRTGTIYAWHRGERPIVAGDGLLDIE